MFKEYYDAKNIASEVLLPKEAFSNQPNLCIFLGCGTSREHSSLGTSVPEAKLFEAKLCETSIDPKETKFLGCGTSRELRSLGTSVPYLIGILKKSDYEFIANFCKTHNLKLYVANTKKIYNSYSFFNFTIYDYINSLAKNYQLIESCKLEIRKWIKKYSQIEIIESIYVAFDQYFDNTDGSLTYTFNKIGAISFISSAPNISLALSSIFFSNSPKLSNSFASNNLNVFICFIN
jgi:hypothetical protein